MTVAALYVETGGVYFGLDDVDPWDEARDARLYAGPWPVVAHPPCNRWCRLGARSKRGDDGGTFAAALEAVRTFGGVLEHPAVSQAWPAHGLPRPSTERAARPVSSCEPRREKGLAATSPRRVRIHVPAKDGWPVIVRGVSSEVVCDACGARLRSRTHAEARKALRLHRLEAHT